MDFVILAYILRSAESLFKLLNLMHINQVLNYSSLTANLSKLDGQYTRNAMVLKKRKGIREWGGL